MRKTESLIKRFIRPLFIISLSFHLSTVSINIISQYNKTTQAIKSKIFFWTIKQTFFYYYENDSESSNKIHD